MPASVLRPTENGVERVCVRTCLVPDVALADHTALSLAQVIELVQASQGETIVHGHEAIGCLRALAQRLEPGGFVLVNDFEHQAKDSEAADESPYPVYGGALAIGLNLTQIEQAN